MSDGTIARMRFRWNGEAFVPWRRFADECDKLLVVGLDYVLEVQEDRSEAEHRFYFAAVNKGWKNLPEKLDKEFASPDQLRKWCLIKAGYRNVDIEVFESESAAIQALRYAMKRKQKDFSIIEQRGPTLTELTAKSQSLKAMGKKDFQESKAAVLDIIAGMIGVRPEQLLTEAQRSE